jgi:secreted PhoX family phosphatase
MGQFRHEAAVTHAPTGDVYLTEDREPRGGFYRFVPKKRDELAAGGRLQMLKAEGATDLRRGLRVGQSWQVSWVDIDEPSRAHTPGHTDGSGVVNQGLAGGATAFTRLEGCHATDTAIYFTATNGGDASSGQVFAYHPRERRLSLIFESTGLDTVDYPDNLCFSPRGGLVVCEDGQRDAQMLWGLGLDGKAFPLAKNNVVLDKPVNGFTGDFRSAEWAGTCFSPDGKWLFANIYAPGITVAITGPWKKGLV